MPVRVVTTGEVSNINRDHFASNGCLLVRGLYSEEEIHSALDRVVSGRPKEGFESTIWVYSNEITSIGPGFSRTDAEWNLYQKPELVSLVRSIAGWDKMYWHDITGTLVMSWPNQKDGTWLHLDYAGEPITQDEGLIYGMIYLTDVDESGARTKVVPGSHTVARDRIHQNPDDPRNLALCDDVEFLGP